MQQNIFPLTFVLELFFKCVKINKKKVLEFH